MSEADSAAADWIDRTGGNANTLIWNQAHLRHALREYERHYSDRESFPLSSPINARPELV